MPKNTQTININFDASMDIAQVKAAVSAIEKSFSGIKLPQGLFNRLTTDLQKLQDELTNFSSLSSNMKNLSDIGKSEKSLEKIISLYRRLQLEISEIDGLDPKKLLPDSVVQKIGKVEKAFSSYQSSITEIGKEADATKKKIEKLLKLKEEHRQLASTRSSDEKRKREVEAELPRAQARATIAKETTAAAKKSGVDINSQEYLELVEAQKQAENEAKSLNDELKRLQSSISSSTTSLQKNEEAQKQFSDITETFGTKVKDLKQAFDTMGQTQAAEALQKLKEQLSQIDGFDVSNLKDDLSNLDDLTRGLSAEALEKIENGLEEIKKNSNEAERGIESMDNALGETAKSGEELTRTANEVERLKEQVSDFFSIGNSIELFKQAIRSAFDTVKELDAAMTETAVVTDFTVGDMWSQLPEYSKMAKDLGTSLLDSYNAATLYYQQGLKTNEVMAVSNETLKMARIASMDAADATDLMTAALRGFNMEINEGSAQRVNDVYSELAAVTAADTQEIGIAMSKTASIAASANMEFETTAALLSQIIETTREAPETAGTAMKTIIARFTEVKTLFSEGQLTGTDTEGEEININKIDEALKTVGISLKDFLNGTKGIDDIFLELASKWDTLDIATQRYIATTAAGSRQQSRFLAMMSNYDRTMELVNAAYNSTGASQEQFGKTLDSLEAKLNNLKNAWDTFTMNLANNEIIKAAVDTLSFFLTTINNIIEAVSGGNGLAKSFLSLATAIAGLKIGKTIFNSVFSKIKDNFTTAGKQSATSFIDGFKKSSSSLKQGFSDIALTLIKNIAKVFKNNLGKELSSVFSSLKLKATGISDFGLTEQIQQDFTSKMGGELTGDAQIAWNTFTNNIKNGSMSATEAIKPLNDILNRTGQQLQVTEGMSNQVSETMGGKVSGAFTSAATAIGGVGIVLGLLSTIFDDLGLDGWADTINTISTAFISLAGILMIIPPLCKAIGVSIKAIPIIGWIAAIITGIITLASLISQWVESDEEKIERLNKSIEEAGNEIEDARSKIEELTSQKESLDSLQSSFEGLTKGTNAWKQKLIEVNSQVLDLITKYPKLNAYLTRGAQGQLDISDEGFDAVIESQQQRVFANQAAQVGLRQQKISLQQSVDTSDKRWEALVKGTEDIQKNNPEAYQNTPTVAREFVSEEQYQELAGRIAEAGLSAQREGDKAQIEEIFNDVMKGEGYFEDFYYEISTAGKYFDELATGVMATNQALEAERDALIDTTIAADEQLNNSDFNKQAAAMADVTFDDMGEKIQEKVDSYGKGISDDLKESYSEITGLTIDEINAKIKDESLSETTMKTTVATSEVQEDMTGKMKETIAAFEKLEKGLGKTDKNLYDAIKNTVTDEGSGLTQKDIDSLTSNLGVTQEDLSKMSESELASYEDEINELLKSSGTSLEELGLSATEFMTLLATGSETLEHAYDLISSYGMEDLAKTSIDQLNQTLTKLGSESQLSAGQTKKFADAMAGVAERGGNVEAFGEDLNNLLSNIKDPDDLEQVINLLTATDWSSSDNIEETIKSIESLGYDIDSELTDKLRASSAALKSLNLEKLEKKLLKLDSAIKNVEGKIESGTSSFSTEEFEALKEAGAEDSDFIRTGIDEYTYIGENTNTLLETLNGNVASILAEMQGNIDEAVERGAAFEEFFEEETTWENGKNNKQIVESLVNGAYGIGSKKEGQEGFISREDAIAIIEKLQFTEEDTDLTSYSNEGLQALLKTAYENFYGTGGTVYSENKATQEDQEKENQTLLMMQEKSSDAVRLAGGTEEEQIAKARSDAAQLGISTTELDAYAQKLQDITEKSKEVDTLSEAMAIEIAKDNMMMNEAIKELASNWDTWKGALQNSNKNTAEYSTALNSLKRNIQQMLGITDDLSEDFLTNKENLKLMERAAKGDAEAINDLRKAAAKDIILHMDLSDSDKDKIIDGVNDFVNSAEYDNLTIGAQLDNTSMVEGLNQMLRDGTLTVEQMNSILQGIGWQPEITYAEMPLSEVESFTGNQSQEIMVPRYENGMIVGYDKTTVSAAQEGGISGTQMVRVPIIGSQAVKASGLGYNTGIMATYSGSPKSTVNPSNRPSSSGGGGGGGGGSKKEKEEPWENPYDWLYNLTQDINEELRKREKLELRYDRILRDRSKNAKDLYDNIKAQTASLKEQERLQQQMLSKRQQEMRDYLSKNSSLSSYGTFNWADNTIEINWDKINSVTDQEKGEEIEEYISKLEEIQGQMNDAEDALDEIVDQIYELQQIGKDEFDDLESRTLDALIQRDQEAIDKLSNINDSINNANQKLLDSVQRNLDQIRQDRQNEETEQNLAEKERQLAYLRQDTSGANAMQIRQLEEELANEQESYTDTLIDQKISELQQQNDEAAEQRERQIELAQAQLDYAQENGLYWQEAHKIMQEGVNAAGALIKGSELVSILGSAEGWDAMSEIQQMNWLSQLEETSKQALQYFAQQRQLENIGKKSGSITFTNANGQTLTGTVQSDGSVKVSTGSGTYTYKDVYQNYDGTYRTLEGQSDASYVANKPATPPPSSNIGSSSGSYYRATPYRGYSIVDGLKAIGEYTASEYKNRKKIAAANGIKNYTGSASQNTQMLRLLQQGKLKKYAKGGLVDTTGLAWLDGTASNPEMVLRAKDTENFIQLKNILAEVLKSKENAISERSGDNYFEIYIEVDSLGNDYDVEQLAGKIKRMINEDARYRNVNAINILR